MSSQPVKDLEKQMKIDEIRQTVDGLPFMTFPQAKTITDIIVENQFKNILELGFHHGVSTCYMAGAIDELGGGNITTIDLISKSKIEPNINDLLNKLGLVKFVTAIYEPTSYTWRLMKMLEEDPSPRFDFCYLDGAHSWFVDGFAFFLIDRLLKPGGLILFDDINWTYDISSLRDTQQVKQMPQDERSIPQVRKIYELLVKPHPSYGEFIEKDGWAYARKTSTETKAISQEIRKEIVYQKEYVGLGAAMLKIIRKIVKQ
jgi:predicted O-methyltransferase YrrM